MNYLQITIPTTDPCLQEILVALLPELGFEGFEQQEDALQGFLPEQLFDGAKLDALVGRYGLSYTPKLIRERNWNEEWEKNFQPVRVGDFCAVRAHFHAPVEGVIHDLIITPKMSFGTGHHATTFMMLLAMQGIDFQGRTVLDFGTGTGVLAVLAERLGADSVLAIDNDSWSIENARENITENNCMKISLLQTDKIALPDRYDIILANINKHVLLREMAFMGQQLGEGGVILMSGLLQDDFEDIENQVVINGLFLSGRMTEGSWICLKIEKKIK
jgi:ribosomal protein L11 methyltransferase